MRSQSVNTLLGCAAAALLATSVQATLTIDTPSALAECLPTAITWKDATPPVYISAYPKGNTAGKAYTLITKSDQASGSFSWTVNLTAGTTTTLGIRDKTGQVQATAPVSIYEAPAGTDKCDAIKPYDGGADSAPAGGRDTTPAGGSNSTASGGGSDAPATSGKDSGSSTSGGASGGSTKATAGGAKNATETADPTAKNGTATAGTSTDNSTVPVDGSTTTPTDTSANDAPSNLWVGSSDQNYILIVSVLLSTAMAVMIGAWSE